MPIKGYPKFIAAPHTIMRSMLRPIAYRAYSQEDILFTFKAVSTRMPGTNAKNKNPRICWITGIPKIMEIFASANASNISRKYFFPIFF
jgi:hypothetical protein